METNILWTGIEYHSLENCLIKTTNKGTQIASTIVGYYDNKIYKVDYSIVVNRQWETIAFRVESRHSDRTTVLHFESDGDGNWTDQGRPLDEFVGCIDIDIPLTPFTNSLPINRLQLQQGQEREIKVIYLDLLNDQLKPVRQLYRKVSGVDYHYQNVPNDFEATIQVDALGLVVHYPELFTRTAALHTGSLA